jgi:hypothetical protein
MWNILHKGESPGPEHIDNWNKWDRIHICFIVCTVLCFNQLQLEIITPWWCNNKRFVVCCLYRCIKWTLELRVKAVSFCLSSLWYYLTVSILGFLKCAAFRYYISMVRYIYNKTANGVRSDIEHRLYQRCLYFQTVVFCHCNLVSVISFPSKRKV